jgi:hypothetical protein
MAMAIHPTHPILGTALPWGRAFLEKLIVPGLIKTFQHFTDLANINEH